MHSGHTPELQGAELFDLGLDLFARLESIQPGKLPALSRHRAFLVENGDEAQLVALAALEIVGVMRRRDLHRARAELGIDQNRVGDHGECTIGKRVPNHLANLRLVPRIIRVHRHCRVAQHGFRPRGCDHDLARAISQRIGKLPQLTLRALVVLDLEIRQCSPTGDAPVDEATIAVDEPLFVQTHECLDDCPRVVGLHGELQALPVQGAAHHLELFENAAAVALPPVPDALDELLASDVVAGFLLGRAQLAFHHHLGGDAGMVRARKPHGVVRGHAPPANKNVLDGAGERMAHVQRSRHVGGRNHDAEGRLGCGRISVEVATIQPLLVPAGLNSSRVVGLREIGHGVLRKVQSTSWLQPGDLVPA